MKNLKVESSHFITYSGNQLTIDVLGGINLQNVERMDCTLRIYYGNYPPMRITFNLFNDSDVEKQCHAICNKWDIKLSDVSKALFELTQELEEYRLQELRYIGKRKPVFFDLKREEKINSTTFLKGKDLFSQLTKKLNDIGILGEDENAAILFLALASYKFNTPFSVLCHAKSGIGKSYLLQKLSNCMPDNAYSFHSHISENALFYFNSSEIQNKALIVEDLEWTYKMLQPLSTLQTQGKLIKTRATKDKEGMLHSTTFDVRGNLCLVACTQNEKNNEELSLPFLSLYLNHSHEQDLAIMDYQKKCKAGEIKTEDTLKIQHQLKCLIASLEQVNVINPYATLINLPQDIPHPRKSLSLLLNFIDVITYFFQYQRETIINEDTGEILVKTHPDDIALAFKLLKNSLVCRADELSVTTRGFYTWLSEQKIKEFKAIDIRKTQTIHPRTLNRYLYELKQFNYIKVDGGNQYRGGFIYKLTGFGDQTDVNSRIEKDIQNTLEAIKKAHQQEISRTVSQKAVSNSKKQAA